jgi:phage gp36-like protein
MSYITIDQLKNRAGAAYGRFIDETKPDDVAAAAAIITESCAQIDAFAAARYSVPLASGELVRNWALDIAVYKLYARGDMPELPEKIVRAYDDALDALKMLAKGTLTLPGATPKGGSASGMSIAMKSNRPIFGSEY